MPMPAPAIMAAAKPAAASSTFLTGPVGYGLAAGAASALPGMMGSGSVNFRGKYARNQLKHDVRAIKAKMLANVEGAKAAGLHPLAALGIAPGGAGPQPGIPGQSDLGGAIETGVKTATTLAMTKQAQAAALEEQTLRNDWLKQQMRHSEIKLAAQLANSRRPPGRSSVEELTRAPTTRVPHHSEGMPGRFTHSDGTVSEPYRGGTSADDLDKEINDWAQWMPDIMGRAWDIFKSQVRHNTGISGDYWERSKREYERANPPKQYKKQPRATRGRYIRQ